MSAREQEAIFRRWLDVHLGLMLKIVRGCAAPQDQDDLFQDVCLQLWQSIPGFRGDAKETTWIYRVAFNTALVWRRGETRRHAKHDRFAKCNAVEQGLGAQSISPAEERVEQLFEAIRQLPKLDASLALMYLDGLSYRAISEVLGITETNVGVKLNRIRKQLAALLKGENDEL
jgi:RNA polymerase sigma-70 factor (ECF subfamily)